MSTVSESRKTGAPLRRVSGDRSQAARKEIAELGLRVREPFWKPMLKTLRQQGFVFGKGDDAFRMCPAQHVELLRRRPPEPPSSLTVTTPQRFADRDRPEAAAARRRHIELRALEQRDRPVPPPMRRRASRAQPKPFPSPVRRSALHDCCICGGAVPMTPRLVCMVSHGQPHWNSIHARSTARSGSDVRLAASVARSVRTGLSTLPRAESLCPSAGACRLGPDHDPRTLPVSVTVSDIGGSSGRLAKSSTCCRRATSGTASSPFPKTKPCCRSCSASFPKGSGLEGHSFASLF